MTLEVDREVHGNHSFATSLDPVPTQDIDEAEEG